MMRNKKLGLAVAWLTIAILSIGIYPNSHAADRSSRDVRIAANLPLSGDLATYGVSVRDGATLAAEDLAKEAPSGPKAIVDWQDNAGDPKAAVSIMQKQYLEPPDVYVSGVKPQTMAIKGQIEARGTPHFLWIFDAFINKGTRNNLRTWVNYKIEAPVYLEYVKGRQPKRVAIVYVNLPHSREEFTVLVVPKLKNLGVTKTFLEAYPIDQKDYKDIAVKVRDFKPDLIILNGFQATLVGLVRALRPLGLITDGNTISTYDMLDAAKVLGGDETEGIRVVAPQFVTRLDRKEIADWSQRFDGRFGRAPLYTDAYAYDMMTIIYSAAQRLSLPATPERWIEALRTTRLDGITGPCSFDEDGDLITPLEIGVYRKGVLVPERRDKEPQ